MKKPNKMLGTTYLGSKQCHAHSIMQHIPPADVFVDLFGGGGAMTQMAVKSCKYKKVIMNDPRTVPHLQFLLDNNNYKTYLRRTICREDFNAEHNLLLKICWSFAGRGVTYCASKNNERVYTLIHEYVVNGIKPYELHFVPRAVWPDWGELPDLDDIASRITQLQAVFKQYFPPCNNVGKYTDYWPASQLLTDAEDGLMSDAVLITPDPITKVYRLNHFLNFIRAHADIIELQAEDYRDVIIPPHSVVYCDPPYDGTEQYAGQHFATDVFRRWALSVANKHPTYISEYNMPEPFRAVWSKTIPVRSQLNKAGEQQEQSLRTERLYTLFHE